MGLLKLRHRLNQAEKDVVCAFSLDAEKAFDQVQWEFLLKMLSHFGFEVYVINLIRILYKRPKVAVIIDCIVPPFLNLTRGACQGCPLSPLLFSMELEPLTIAIK